MAQRVVFLSFLTARLDASNAYLRYKAEAEAALRSCGIPAVIFRCDHFYGPPNGAWPDRIGSVLAHRVLPGAGPGSGLL
jgi:uncharacterized protein YbjT (DUF2867 family)